MMRKCAPTHLKFRWRDSYECGKFTVFCAEQYKLRKNLTGRQLTSLFQRYDVWDYLFSCYEALHTTGTNYIIADIDQYIQERKAEPVIN